MVKRRKRKLKKRVLLLVICVFSVYLVFSGKSVFDRNYYENKNSLDIPIKKIEIVDLYSKSRPIAVMINNHPSARPYHSGLQDAYLAYEIIVEGGFTRYMAVYKDKNTGRIGSVRSSRHYFLDYALENDAIYIHWGYSPIAGNEMKSYQVDHFDGIKYENKYFFRDRTLNVSLEHTGFTNMELIQRGIIDFNFRTETNKGLLLNYSSESVDLSSYENAIEANEVVIPYSGVVTTSYQYDKQKKIYLRSVNDKVNIVYSNSTATSYVYDSENKVYKRYVNDVEHVDHETKEQYTVKNIITYQVSNHTLTGDVKGRQDIDNIGIGNGYYITEGYAVPIKWEKKYKSSQTVYTYADGTEINVNDGNTWIHIHPISKKLTINGQKES